MALFVTDRALIDNPHGGAVVVAILCTSGVGGLVAEWVWRGWHLRDLAGHTPESRTY